MQALEKQDEQIEELESSAAEMQQELASANENLEQQASTMQKVRQLRHLPNVDSVLAVPRRF
jgi:predicted transcriptional regulator